MSTVTAPAVKPSYGGPLGTAFAVALLAMGAGVFSYRVFTNPASGWYAGKQTETPASAVSAQAQTPAGEPGTVPAVASMATTQAPVAASGAEPAPATPPAGTPPGAPAGGIAEQPVAGASATVAAVPAEAPKAEPVPEAKPEPEIQKWPTKVVEKAINPKGVSKITVQGEPGKKLRPLAVDDLVVPVFYALPLNSGAKSLSSAGLSAVKSALDKVIQEKTVEEKPEGVKIEFSADLAAVRKSLSGRGFDVDKNWKLEINLVRNVSYSSAADVVAAIRKGFEQKVPYLVDGEYRASEKRITGDFDGMKIVVDDVPYKVTVSGYKSESGTVKLDVATANP